MGQAEGIGGLGVAEGQDQADFFLLKLLVELGQGFGIFGVRREREAGRRRIGGRCLI